MNLYNVYVQILFIFLLFTCTQSIPTPVNQKDNLKTSKLSNSIVETNENTIDDHTLTSKIDNLTSSNDSSKTDDQLLNSIKKQIDSKLIDEQLTKSNSIENVVTSKTCNETSEYKCKETNKCIDRSVLCDGFKDCPMGDDEENCNQNCTQHNKFQCKSDGKCIDLIFKCNSFPDCKDGSDEVDCDSLLLPTECSKDEFECSSGGCIHKNKVCDRSSDCDDGSDELFCKYTCGDNEFQCKKDNKCIPLSMKCNGQSECSDGSDEEENCLQNDSNYTCGPNEFSCQMEPHKCISIENVCNDIDDCGNNADEPPECQMDLCKNHHCAHSCEQVRNMVKCICKPGFKLSSNGIDCEDLNECIEIPGFCSGHECINQIGNATCNCGTGYRFNENENRCKVINGKNATIVYSNQNELRNTSLSIKSYLPSFQNPSEQIKNNVIRVNLGTIGMFAYDFADNYIIWHAMDERRFYIANLDEHKRPAERNEFWTHFNLPIPHHHRSPRTPLNKNQHYVLLENITNVEGMALDYVHDLLYWTDTEHNVIEVINVRNPKKRKILVDTDLDEPKGIVVDVDRSFIIFTDWGNKPRIEYIKQDGTGRRTIYDKNLEWPYSIALDSFLEKIYWVDTKKNTLNVVNLDGQNHQVLIKNSMYLERANDLDIFEDKIYWSDQESESILSVDKFKPKSTLNVLVKDLKNVLSSKIVHYSKQITTIQSDLCAKSNCEFLCLPRNDLNSYVCACSDSKILNNEDKRSCVEDKKKIKPIRSPLPIFPSSSNGFVELFKTYRVAIAISMILFVAVICFFFFLNYAKKKANKLKFNNAQYQKTPQQDERPLPYLEPLNQPSTNGFV